MLEKKALLSLPIALASLGLVIACGGDEPPKPNPAPARPEASKAPMTKPAPAPIARQEAPPSLMEEMKKQIEIPEDYPADGFVYPGSKPSTTAKVGKGRISVMFTTKDPVDDVVTSATEFLEKEWGDVDRADMPNGTLLRASKNGDRAIAVLVSDLPDAAEKTDTLIAVAIDP